MIITAGCGTHAAATGKLLLLLQRVHPLCKRRCQQLRQRPVAAFTQTRILCIKRTQHCNNNNGFMTTHAGKTRSYCSLAFIDGVSRICPYILSFLRPRLYARPTVQAIRSRHTNHRVNGHGPTETWTGLINPIVFRRWFDIY